MSETIRREMQLMLEGYGLTTAEITYRMPDYQDLLQTYIWQEYDQAPKFPVFIDFLKFWNRELEGPLHSIKIAHHSLIAPVEWQHKDHELLFH